jgi:hypothetical protein
MLSLKVGSPQNKSLHQTRGHVAISEFTIPRGRGLVSFIVRPPEGAEGTPDDGKAIEARR